MKAEFWRQVVGKGSCVKGGTVGGKGGIFANEPTGGRGREEGDQGGGGVVVRGRRVRGCLSKVRGQSGRVESNSTELEKKKEVERGRKKPLVLKVGRIKLSGGR